MQKPAKSPPPAAEADHAGEALMARVGARVRGARDAAGLSRRVLSEISGVSPRYLAQLEAGEGNISIGLLNRVASALDQRIEWFVGEDDPWPPEVARIATLYRAADSATQGRVLRVLDPAPVREQRAQRICLLGLRGAGKSTLGRAAGAKLGVPFIELNREIEDMGGMPVAEIIALYGQEGYRKLELDALERVIATTDRALLAVAGGIVAEPVTFARLLARFHTIWIKASPEEHMARVRAQGDTRPMAGNPEAMAQLRAILTSREQQYTQAEAALDTTGATPAHSLDQLVALIAEQGFLG